MRLALKVSELVWRRARFGAIKRCLQLTNPTGNILGTVVVVVVVVVAAAAAAVAAVAAPARAAAACNERGRPKSEPP